MPDRIKVYARGAREKIETWVALRGGVAVWKNENLSDPTAGDMYTPALTDGGLTKSPRWSHPGPQEVVKDLSRFLFASEVKEVKRFRVAVRQSRFVFKLTDASSRKLRTAMDKAGEGAFYEFDYETQEAVIYKVVRWEDGNGKNQQENGVEKAESCP